MSTGIQTHRKRRRKRRRRRSGGKIVDWKSFQDLVQRWIFRWRADRYREKHGRPVESEFAKSSPLRKEIESHRDPIDPRPLPPQLYLIKNDRGGSARETSFHSSLFLLYPPLLPPPRPRGTLLYSRASPSAPVFRIGLIKLNEPSHRGIASQLRYFLWPCPLPFCPSALVTCTQGERAHSLFAHVFLPFLACRGKLGDSPMRPHARASVLRTNSRRW